MNTKYTVEIDDELLMFFVVEWDEGVNGVRFGTTVGTHREEWIANAECEILNVGYEYEMSAICASEFDA